MRACCGDTADISAALQAEMSDDEGHSEDEEDSDIEGGQLVGSGVKHQADVADGHCT